MSVSVSRPQITARISDLVKKHIDPNNDPRIYWAKEVTFDYASEHSIRVDFMRYKPVNNSVSGIEKGGFLLLRGEIIRGRLSFEEWS